MSVKTRTIIHVKRKPAEEVRLCFGCCFYELKNIQAIGNARCPSKKCNDEKVFKLIKIIIEVING